MSIQYSGLLKRGRGITGLIRNEIKLINLKAVKRVSVTFDPFSGNEKSTR